MKYLFEFIFMLIFVFLCLLPSNALALSSSQTYRLSCGDLSVQGEAFIMSNYEAARSFNPWQGDICTQDPLPDSYILCDDCDRKCPDRVQNVSSKHLFISRTSPSFKVNAVWFQHRDALPAFKDDVTCQFTEDNVVDSSNSTDALRSFSKTSVLFVSISFIILMVISLAWLVFYYVQRFRYAHAKDRLHKRLFNAARKALGRIPTRQLRAGDPELDTDCAICIELYQTNDLVRALPCRHVYHKSCIDPWLLEHRTCPMCKADILKYFGYQVMSTDSVRGVDTGDIADAESPEPQSIGSEAAAFSFTSQEHEQFRFHSTSVPQLVMSSASAKSYSIVPLTVHSQPTEKRQVYCNSEHQPSTSRGTVDTATHISGREQTSQAGRLGYLKGFRVQRLGRKSVPDPRKLDTDNLLQGERSSSLVLPMGDCTSQLTSCRHTSPPHPQIMNLVQVRARDQSCTRAVPIRKCERTNMIPSTPAPVEATSPTTSDVL